ncbi:MAG: cytochrome P450 [Gemmataceae bacterium]|nr:cytochrome P450 [Gemmataceae bacterium]
MSLLARLRRLPGQLFGRNPFGGTLTAHRLPLLSTAPATARNFRTPLRVLDHVFRDDRDLLYLDVPGFTPILFARDPEFIRAVTVGTANGGPFDRDTLPTQGIARVVGGSNLLYSQGPTWKRHRAAAARPFGAGAVQTPEVYHGIEAAIRRAVAPQLDDLADRVRRSPTGTCRMRLEPDIKAVMLNVLVNVLFGVPVPHAELKAKYLPAIEHVIRYILVDTVANPLGLPVSRLTTFGGRHARLKRDRRVFEELVRRVVAARDAGAGFWPLLTAAGPPEAVASNVRVFLAGALEATASFVGWALGNLARHPAARERAYREALTHADLCPEAWERSVYLRRVLTETVRLNNALYFLPRVAVRDATVETSKGTITIPAGTHLVLATYHSNRCERFWGVAATGHPATAFAPDRWDPANPALRGRGSKELLHWGFGHGPRVCVGKHFSEAEAFVCLTLFLRRFEFRAVRPEAEADSGVSTRPADGVEVELSLRRNDEFRMTHQ